VLHAVTEDYLRRSGLDIKLDHGVDHMAMAMSLVASTRASADAGLCEEPAALVCRHPSAGRGSAGDRPRGGLQQCEQLADSQAVPVARRRTKRLPEHSVDRCEAATDPTDPCPVPLLLRRSGLLARRDEAFSSAAASGNTPLVGVREYPDLVRRDRRAFQV
jgi:hypothetical protein